MRWREIFSKPAVGTTSNPASQTEEETTVQDGSEEPTWHPDPAQIATMVKMRRRELLSISRRLDRVKNKPRGRAYEIAATLLVGGVIGGAFGLLPFLAQRPNPDTVDRFIYFGLLGVGLLLARVCWRAASDMSEERTDTVAAIKEDLDHLLEGSLHNDT
jgi:hypothetical protein